MSAVLPATAANVLSALPVPKYHQVYLLLRQQLEDGSFHPRMPGELALQRQFGVARITVRKALEQLAAEGRITREAGRGTRAVARTGESALARGTRDTSSGRAQKLTGLLENLVSMGLSTQVTVLENAVITPTQAIAEALQIGAEETEDQTVSNHAPKTVPNTVHKAVRVRHSPAGPISHITTHIPMACLGRQRAGFSTRALQSKPILLLLEGAGVRVGRAEQSITACLADIDTARHLDVAVGSALLKVRRLVYGHLPRDSREGTSERPVQLLQGLYRPDRYEYAMQLSRVGDIDAKVWVSKELAENIR
jgi:GntR family transcriptional regulator